MEMQVRIPGFHFHFGSRSSQSVQLAQKVFVQGGATANVPEQNACPLHHHPLKIIDKSYLPFFRTLKTFIFSVFGKVSIPENGCKMTWTIILIGCRLMTLKAIDLTSSSGLSQYMSCDVATAVIQQHTVLRLYTLV